MPATCSGPECSRPAVAGGLCPSHHAWSRRNPGAPLRPLAPPVGQRGEGERISIRVNLSTLERLRSEGPPATVARRVLERWARE